MRKPFSTPVVRDCITRRAPLASLTMVARTPRSLVLLILSRIFSSVSSPGPMLIDTLVLPALGVKPLRSSAQAPMSIVSVPCPSTLLARGRALLAFIWAAARSVTLTQ